MSIRCDLAARYWISDFASRCWPEPWPSSAEDSPVSRVIRAGFIGLKVGQIGHPRCLQEGVGFREIGDHVFIEKAAEDHEDTAARLGSREALSMTHLADD